MAPYQVGVIGCGRKGTGHARAYYLNPMTEVVAAADSDPDNLRLFCERFRVRGYSRYEEMLEHEEIDIAAPILPVKINPEVVLAGAEAGVKAIFSEKPISASLAEADHDPLLPNCRLRMRRADGMRQIPDQPCRGGHPGRKGQKGRSGPAPHALRKSRSPAGPEVRRRG